MSFFENKRYWIRELGNINCNLPKNRIKLEVILEAEKPFFESKQSEIIFFPKKEMKEFCKQISPDMYQFIRLPFIILQKKDIFVTSGNKYDSWVIERLMGHESLNTLISIKLYAPKHEYYYSYQINRLRKQWPTIIQIAYSM